MNNENFIKCEVSRAHICGESANSVLFVNQVNNNKFYCGISKKIIFKNEYKLTVNINFPTKGKGFKVGNNNGETVINNVEDLIKTMNFTKK